MRQNVTVIDLNLNHCYVPKHKKQVQLDELEHFATKEQAVIDLMKKQKTKPRINNKKKLFFSVHFLCSQRCQSTTTRRPV